ncbi:type II toxin-antitoxin system mRNA interferase toxin, RelE/StbE family [Candidatus Peregrinibacteria bacterium CG10_big_fil_rev_8_21_14_0_10_36_19]|nr:MAG: type II toxin-antitoxin system mRNA interferase toxin, RelE/StbE family [Candidatus Peregrinibacteria bacterium CG10_big_fil_rev_8_21_14_0_10_36_19]
MKRYKIYFTKQAKKDIEALSPKLKAKLKDVLLEVVCVDPFCGKKLLGELKGNYSYRLDLKNRIVYSVKNKEKVIYIKRAKTHYGD